MKGKNFSIENGYRGDKRPEGKLPVVSEMMRRAVKSVVEAVSWPAVRMDQGINSVFRPRTTRNRRV